MGGIFAKQLRESVTLCLFEEGTRTHFIGAKPMCLHYKDRNMCGYELCAYPAGHGTDHPGVGCCNVHSEITLADIGRMGRYATATDGAMRAAYESYVTDKTLLDIAPELAMQRTLLTEMLFKWREMPGVVDERVILQLLRDITDTVGQIEKIQSQHVLTAATARYMITRALEVVRKFVPPDRLPEFVELWRAEVEAPVLGTNVQVLLE